MDRKQKGFTLIEILVVVTIIGVLAGLVVVLIPKGKEKANQIDCINNVKQLCGLLVQLDGQKLPAQSGVNLMLYLFKSGELEKDDRNFGLLFCPGDQTDTWELSGGQKAYDDAELSKQGEYGHLSSYAGRNQLDRKCAANMTSTKTQALISDDSEDHHNKKGFVVGYTDGSAKFQEKFKAWEIDVDTEVRVGEGSEVEELKCLNSDD